jgi:hypothetical protein
LGNTVVLERSLLEKWENGKTSSEHEWSKKYVYGLLAGFPGGTLFSAAILRSCGVAVGRGALSANLNFFDIHSWATGGLGNPVLG